MAEGWSTDPCKNLFGQMILNEARALQSATKMQIFDLPSSKVNLRVRQVFQHGQHVLTQNRPIANNIDML